MSKKHYYGTIKDQPILPVGESGRHNSVRDWLKKPVVYTAMAGSLLSPFSAMPSSLFAQENNPTPHYLVCSVNNSADNGEVRNGHANFDNEPDTSQKPILPGKTGMAFDVGMTGKDILTPPVFGGIESFLGAGMGAIYRMATGDVTNAIKGFVLSVPGIVSSFFFGGIGGNLVDGAVGKIGATLGVEESLLPYSPVRGLLEGLSINGDGTGPDGSGADLKNFDPSRPDMHLHLFRQQQNYDK